MPSKDGWTHERDHEKVTLGKKQYRNMEEWSRPCAVCGEKFAIFVRANAGAVNSSFGLKTCKEHRGQKIGGGTVVVADAELRAELAEMKKERDEYANTITDEITRNGKLVREIAALKAQLAQYELPAAIAAMPWQK